MNDKFDKTEKKINVDQVVGYLNHAFAKATTKAAPNIGTRAIRFENKGNIETTVLYDYQVEFCYLINEIQRGPMYIVPKLIQEVNELIAQLEKETATTSYT